MRNAFISTLTELAERDPDVWLLNGDVGFSVLEPFIARFPDRCLNVGVAEQNMAGIAAGLALSGKTVFVYSIGNFPTLRCLEQVRNDICYHGADVKLVAVGAGYAYGSQGYTHHAVEDVGIMSMLPGIEVFAPCDPAEVRAITLEIARSGRPSYLRLGRSGEPVLGPLAPGCVRGARRLRGGHETTILASGTIAETCLRAAERLEQLGREVGVISMPCLKPFDGQFVREIAGKAELLATVEEHVLRGGLYASVAAALAGVPDRAPLVGFGIPEHGGKPSVAGTREALLHLAGLSPEKLVEGITSALDRPGAVRT